MSTRSDVVSLLVDRREQSLRGLIDVSARCIGSVNVADAVEAEERMDDLARYNGLLDSLSAPLPEHATPYRRDGGASFLFDIGAASNDAHAAQRLAAHNRVSTRANLGATTAGQGSEFVPPAWLMDQAVGAARSGRPFLNTLRAQALPSHTASIRIPTVTSGTVVGSHVDGATPTASNEATSALSVPVIEVVTRVQTSLQFLEWGGPAADAFVYAELVAAAENEADRLAVAGSGSSGDPTGIQTAALASGTTIAFTGTTTAALLSKLGAAVSAAAVARGIAPSHLLWHPRRSAWVAANATADVAAGLGLLEVQRVADGNITTAAGGSTNEDRAIAYRADDLLLFEDPPTVMVTVQGAGADTLSATIVVRKRYAIAIKYASALAVLTGSGLALTAT